MSSIPDGSYHYYTHEGAKRPIVCEVMADFVAQAGEPDWRPISLCVGTFVRLQEVQMQWLEAPCYSADTPVLTPERIEALRYILGNSLDEYNETLPETIERLEILSEMLKEISDVTPDATMPPELNLGT